MSEKKKLNCLLFTLIIDIILLIFIQTVLQSLLQNLYVRNKSSCAILIIHVLCNLDKFYHVYNYDYFYIRSCINKDNKLFIFLYVNCGLIYIPGLRIFFYWFTYLHKIHENWFPKHMFYFIISLVKFGQMRRKGRKVLLDCESHRIV